jgi:hypothetical protein
MVVRYHLGLGVGHIYAHHQSSDAVHPSVAPQEQNNDEEVEVCTSGVSEGGTSGCDRMDDGYSSDPDDEDWQDENEDESEDEGEDEIGNSSDDEEILAIDEMYG